MSTGAPTVAPPARGGESAPRPWLALVVAVVLLLLGGGLWWLWPEESPGSGGEPGQGAIGTAPAPEGAGSVGTAPTDADLLRASASPGASASSGATVAPQLPPDVRQGTLLVHTEIRGGSLSFTLRVTISNVGDVTDSWRSVGLHLTGLNLVIAPVGSVVTYQYQAPSHCLVAAAQVVLGPGESIALDVIVTGALGGVQSARLDEAPCPL